jgi:hypothetical protein
MSPLPATPPGALGVTVKDLLGDGVLWVLEGARAPIVKDLSGERALRALVSWTAAPVSVVSDLPGKIDCRFCVPPALGILSFDECS